MVYTNFNLCYMEESSRCLENRVKEQNSHVTSAIYKYRVFNNHPQANISHFKTMDQDSKPVVREARKAIHIRMNYPALNCNTGKMYICTFQKSLTTFLEQPDLPMSLTK